MNQRNTGMIFTTQNQSLRNPLLLLLIHVSTKHLRKNVRTKIFRTSWNLQEPPFEILAILNQSSDKLGKHQKIAIG